MNRIQALIVALTVLGTSAQVLAADLPARRNASCPATKIDFDCDNHVVTMVGSGVKSPLNCGRSTPAYHQGTIGSKGYALGTYWPSMKGAPKINIGLGAVIVHTLPPKNGRTPAGYNTNKPHTGCLNVSPKVMKMLESCKGTPYQIVYSSKGGKGYAKRMKPLGRGISTVGTDLDSGIQ